MPRSIDKFTLTSNRDEAPNRETIIPQVYEMGKNRLIFPKDALAGGTWIGASDKNRLVCLLNGGFEPHKREESYRMSRGIIVTDLLTADDSVKKIDEFNLKGIEPFTIVLVNWDSEMSLHELVWDGVTKHFSEKPFVPHIWSSSLLYSKEIKEKREKWFGSFLFENIRPTKDTLIDFHKNAGDGNIETDLIMNRGFVKTKSISQFSISQESNIFRYEDLQTQEVIKLNF